MRKLVTTGSKGLSGVLLLCLVFLAPDLRAQRSGTSTSSHYPWACRYLSSPEEEAPDISAEEREYDASVKEFYRVWCAGTVSSVQVRKSASDAVAERWKRLWYSTPFNVAFHETGSFGLLALMGVTHRVPKPMIEDPTFMHDWLEDCKERCFMIYGDDDPGAKDEWLLMNRLRDDVSMNLKREPAAKLVLTMLKNAKLYPVN